MIYDTLKLSKALRVSFTPEQSDTLALAFSESTEDHVATKVDVAELKAGTADFRTELKSDIAELRAELKELSIELKNDIATRKVDMVRWISGAIAFNLLGTIGIMIAVAELVAKAK